MYKHTGGTAVGGENATPVDDSYAAVVGGGLAAATVGSLAGGGSTSGGGLASAVGSSLASAAGGGLAAGSGADTGGGSVAGLWWWCWCWHFADQKLWVRYSYAVNNLLSKAWHDGLDTCRIPDVGFSEATVCFKTMTQTPSCDSKCSVTVQRFFVPSAVTGDWLVADISKPDISKPVKFNRFSDPDVVSWSSALVIGAKSIAFRSCTVDLTSFVMVDNSSRIVTGHLRNVLRLPNKTMPYNLPPLEAKVEELFKIPRFTSTSLGATGAGIYRPINYLYRRISDAFLRTLAPSQRCLVTAVDPIFVRMILVFFAVFFCLVDFFLVILLCFLLGRTAVSSSVTSWKEPTCREAMKSMKDCMCD